METRTSERAFEKYHPILEIGEGGMSRVHLAIVRRPGGFNKLQVIKRLLPTLVSDPEFIAMFLEEARLSAKLNHSNIVQINEVGFDGIHPFMAMEYLEGKSLDAMTRHARDAEDPRWTVPMHLRILADACAGLHYAHELTGEGGAPLGIVHRDVSPHNIFVTCAGQVKVLDFGIAKAADSMLHTRTGVLKGKCSYMAPEQFGAQRIDRRADIFALGVMVWQAITRTRMWKGLSDAEIFQRLADRQIPSPLAIDPDLPPPLVAICQRALAHTPADRYRTAAELADDIDAYLAGLPHAVTARDIGKYVGAVFGEERAKVKAAVEVELRKLEDAPRPPPTSRSKPAAPAKKSYRAVVGTASVLTLAGAVMAGFIVWRQTHDIALLPGVSVDSTTAAAIRMTNASEETPRAALALSHPAPAATAAAPVRIPPVKAVAPSRLPPPSALAAPPVLPMASALSPAAAPLPAPSSSRPALDRDPWKD